MTGVDPLSLQIFANLFSSVAERMGVTLQRASFSPNIKMRRDFSCALFDADGRLLAQAAHIPVHLGAMPMAMEAVRARFDLRAGDVVIMNDPYQGGTHLPDVSLISRAFDREGRSIGYVMSRAHHADLGGMSPGSMPLATEIYQEGIIIPPILLRARGVSQEHLLQLILRNVRTPEERRGDFEAQLAAQAAGETGLRELVDRYGHAAVTEHAAALQRLSEEAMRALIGDIPPGTYRYADSLDGDGIDDGPVPIRCAVTRQAGTSDLVIDFTGSSPQRRGGVNAPRAVTTAAVLYVLRCLQGEDTPVNAGSLVPLRIVTPPASVVAAEAPASVAGGNVETSQRIVDVVFGALAGAVPGRVPAASHGTMNNVAFGGWDAKRGRTFAYYETIGGGMGARPVQHGMDAVHDHMSNTLNTPIEVLESEYPVRVTRYRLRAGSGGAGGFHGGAGVTRELLFLASATVTLLTERRVLAPYGLHGGDAGMPGQNQVVSDGRSTDVPGKATFHIEAGETVVIGTPGGGGWGELPDTRER